MTGPRTILVGCDCAGRCGVLGIDIWDDDTYVEIYTRPGSGPWSWRWRKALGLLVGRDVCIDSVCLSAEDTARLSEFLGGAA